MTASSDPKHDILYRYHSLVQDWNRNAAEISALQQKQQEISQRAMDFVGAARVFGFDLDSEYRTWSAQVANIYATPYPNPATSPISTPPPRNRTVRDLVLEIVEHAHPHVVRASLLRKQLEAQGIVVHEKTVGMTLYRLSREHFVRRIGKADWIFQPEAERSETGKENPGDEPGLFGAAG